MISRRECIGTICGYGSALVVANAVPALAAGTRTVSEKTARFWHREGNAVACELCPHGCIVREGKTGKCRNRTNRDGHLVALGYARPCAVHIDPIEKKPLYHVLPGARTYSIGVAGCNLRCKNCQNYQISQRSPLETENVYLPPDQAVKDAVRRGCTVVAFTYTEPSVWLEYVIDTATVAKKAGLRTVLVSSGYINAAPFEAVIPVLDAVRIDLKSFSDRIYQELNAGELQPVLDTLLRAKKAKLWLEIINLVVPGWNDRPDELQRLCRWIAANLGTGTPVHFSRFYPMYQLSNGYPTPVATLKKAVAIAREEKLSYVYIGNVAGATSATVCPSCGKTVVDRSGYLVTVNQIKDGTCGYCGRGIAGVWR